MSRSGRWYLRLDEEVTPPSLHGRSFRFTVRTDMEKVSVTVDCSSTKIAVFLNQSKSDDFAREGERGERLAALALCAQRIADTRSVYGPPQKPLTVLNPTTNYTLDDAKRLDRGDEICLTKSIF